MAIIAFAVKDVKKLVAELEQSKPSGYSATMNGLFDASLYKGGVIRDEKGRTEQEATKAGDYFWPSTDHIDPAKVQPVLQLVGDHGLYLITNARLDGTPSSRGTVAYAEGCNPDKDEDFYENKECLFGGDDGSVDIPLAWAQWAIKAGKRKFKVNLTANQIKLVQH